MTRPGGGGVRIAAVVVTAVVVAGIARVTLSDATDPATGSAPSPTVSVPPPEERRPWLQAACEIPAELFKRIERDHYEGRSPDLIALPQEPNYFGAFVGTSHSGPWDYIQRVPLVFYGPGTVAPQGELQLDREVTLADIAPTLAEILGTPWPEDRAGSALTEVLLPEEQRRTPKVIVTVVWDGGGTNVLEQWPGSWPELTKLMEEGTSVLDAIVGASPSNTPVAHTNIGTGTFPDQHGIVDIRIRRGRNTVDSFVNKPGRFVEVSTIADVYDLEVDNEAEIGLFGYHPWHIGMLGHGGRTNGGDRDLAALVSHRGESIIGVDKRFFEFPEYADDVPGLEEDIAATDAADGTVDGLWLGRDIFDDTFELKKSPVYIRYQTRVVREMLEREGFGRDDIPDLFFVNYKPMDTVGHKYNMVKPEMKSSLRATDAELGELRRILDEVVGPDQWMMIVTADHGQTPMARTTDAWPVRLQEMLIDTAIHFRARVSDLFIDKRVGFIFTNRRGLKKRGITTEDIADFMSTYTLGDNVETKRVPKGYRDRVDERILAAAWPTSETERIAACIRDG